MKSGAALAAVVLVASSCTRLAVPPEPGPLPTPTPAPAPAAEVPSPEPTPEAGDVDVPPPAEEPNVDAILDSPWIEHPRFAAEVERWTRFWTGQEGAWFPVYLERMSAFEPVVREELERRDLPGSLRYLPIIESGYAPTAVSRASAVGLWQLMAATARASGMRVGGRVDERRDPVRATRVATGYLEELHRRFDSWFLVLAAYNAGPSRVARLLERRASEPPYDDGHYWLIRTDLPRETRDFVPRFVAAARIAADPGAYGVAPREKRTPFSYDEVSVPDATSLDVVARAAGVTEDEVASLNPQILRRVTPDGVPTTLRVPEGTARRFNFEYRKIPPSRRVTATEHVVERGETLWGIARQYGVKLAVIERANPEVRPERLRPGDRLVVPLIPSG